MISQYFKSLGLNAAIHLLWIAIVASLVSALFGYINQAFVALILVSIFCLQLLVSVKRDQQRFATQVRLAESGELTEFDSVGSGPMQSLYPLIDNLMRLRERRINQVQSVNDEMGFSASELASNANEVAGLCQKQAEATTSSASAATEISQSIDDVSHRIESTRKVMIHGDQLCHKGRDELTTTQRQIDNVQNSVKQTEASIQELDKQLGGVVSMSRFIQGIAEQTNLLALNAAIEAARAGEHGRGFSVVADEVRSLALRSQESATAITQQVTDVTESMSEVVSQMQEVTNSTESCKSSVDIAFQSIEEIVEAIDDVMGQISGIASASEQQSIATREISKNLEEVAVTAERNAYMANQNASVATHLKNLTGEEKC